jgi:hypothetical protein
MTWIVTASAGSRSTPGAGDGFYDGAENTEVSQQLGSSTTFIKPVSTNCWSAFA